MAELLATEGWPVPDSLGKTLSDALPAEYIVVDQPVVRERKLDVVVAAPQGIFVLHVKNWTGEIKPIRGQDWQVQLETGQQGVYPNPAADVQPDNNALRGFLRDAFPSLSRLDIHHLIVLTNPTATLAPGAAPELLVTNPSNVAHVIMSTPASAGSPALGADTCVALGHALLKQQIMPTQRFSEPFTFRSGGLVGSGKKVWTIKDAVLHMDKHPEDGIFHLGNGTLAGWLEKEEAHALAELAHNVMDTRESDPRVPLEMFLIGTGLVERPRMKVRPKPVNLGCVVSGQSCTSRIEVRKGRGRGYLFGVISTSEPWLRVDPKIFDGRPLEAMVTVDTSLLPISSTPLQADLLIDSSASAEPIAVPVRVQVMGEPSGLNRYAVRPLFDAAVAGLLGATIGWVLGRWGGMGTPWQVLAPPVFWALAIGLVWALIGAARGLRQRSAWPIYYATGRFALRLSLWSIGILLAAVAGLALWGSLSGQPGPAVLSPAGVRTVMFLTALAIIPATLDEMRAARRASDTPIAAGWRSLLRPFLVAGLAIVLIAVVAAGARLARPAWNQLNSTGAVDSTQGWINERWSELEATIDKAVDQFYLWQYDRRAPSQKQ